MTFGDKNEIIIQKLKLEGEEYFERFYKHFFPRLCAFASQFVSRQIAEEVAQETMLWLWKNRDTLIEEMSVISLIFTITKNKSLNIVGREKRHYEILDEIKSRYKEELETPKLYLQNELIELYNKALKKLPNPARETFLMSRNELKTHAEIAEALKVSPQTVNYRMGIALKILREELGDYLFLLLLCLKL